MVRVLSIVLAQLLLLVVLAMYISDENATGLNVQTTEQADASEVGLEKRTFWLWRWRLRRWHWYQCNVC